MATTILLSVSTGLPILDNSCKCNHIVCDFQSLTSFMIHHDFKIHPSYRMYSVSLLLTAEQCSLVRIYHLLFNPSLLMRKWDFITQKNLLIGPSFLCTVTSCFYRTVLLFWQTHSAVAIITTIKRQNISITRTVPLCPFAGGSFLTPRPWQPAGGSHDCMGLSRLENDDPFTEHRASQICPSLYMYEDSVPFDCCVLFHPTSPYVSINSKVSSLLGASAQTLLVSVSSHQFSMLLKHPLADFQGHDLNTKWMTIQGIQTKDIQKTKRWFLPKPAHWNHLGSSENIPDAWSVPRAPAVIAECGLGLRSSQNFPDDSTMQPRWWTREIKGVMVASWKVF